MDLTKIIEWIAGLHPIVPFVLMGLGSVVIIGQIIVAMTPSPDDDAWLVKVYDIPILGPLLKALAAFAPIQKKPKE